MLDMSNLIEQTFMMHPTELVTEPPQNSAFHLPHPSYLVLNPLRHIARRDHWLGTSPSLSVS